MDQHAKYGLPPTWLTGSSIHEPNIFSADCTAYAEGYSPATCSTSTELPDPTVVLAVELGN